MNNITYKIIIRGANFIEDMCSESGQGLDITIDTDSGCGIECIKQSSNDNELSERYCFPVESVFTRVIEYRNLQNEVSSLQGELEKKEEQTSCALKAKDAIISLKDMRIMKLEEDLKELRKILAERDEYIARLEKEAGDKNVDEDLHNRVAELNNAIASQAGGLLKKEVQIAGLNFTIGAKNAVIETKNKECQVLSAENEELKKTLAERDSEIHILKNRVFEGDTVGYRRLKSENEKLKETVALSDERVDELCQKIDRLKKTCADLTRERDVLKKSLAERDETIKDFREGYSKIRTEIAHIRSTINTKWCLRPSAWCTSIWDECEDQIHEIREKFVGLLDPGKTSLGVGVISIDFNKWNKLRKKLSKKEVKLERLEREIKEIKQAMHRE